ncbi:MAG: M24 family metallopeptidase, partial [Phycisphaerae bacterium]
MNPKLPAAARALAAHQLDALLLTSGPDLQYLTGFTHGHAYERLLALVLRADGAATWICPTMNVDQVRPHAAGAAVVPWTDQETYLPALADALDGVTSLAFDDEARAAFLLDALAINPALKIAKAGTVMRPLRIRKSADELAALKRAADTVDQTIPQAIALCRPGQTEADIDAALRAALLARSPDQSVAFTIIAGGPNGAFPHHETARRPLEAGDVVILDYGTIE